MEEIRYNDGFSKLHDENNFAFTSDSKRMDVIKKGGIFHNILKEGDEIIKIDGCEIFEAENLFSELFFKDKSTKYFSKTGYIEYFSDSIVGKIHSMLISRDKKLYNYNVTKGTLEYIGEDLEYDRNNKFIENEFFPLKSE
ncbi:MAG: hypothetical protein KDK36_17530 [Leptospiraceae bacterium]|nr:hypothetical protein [Leptospiraceae bacterium]